ncbi:MAG: D-alanine--D-alanine ligase family protein [Syntrophales bacterium]
MGNPGADHKLRVGIIMGGLSSEKEVSLESGRNIFSKIDRRSYDPVPIFMDGRAALWEIPLKLLMRNSTSDIEEDLRAEAVPIPYESLKTRVDVAFLGLHGKYGEDGCMQGLLELLGVPYTGSGVLASAIGMDKYVSRRILEISGIDVPRTIPVPRREWDANPETVVGRIIREIGFPCIVKPCREGCSTAVTKVVAPEGLSGAVEDAFAWDNLVLAEEFLTGMEVTCGVLGVDAPEALTPSETIPTDDVLSLEDKFLYGQGENKTPARLPAEQIEKVRETAVGTFRALNLKGYARIDMFVRPDGRVAVLEPNTLPGMTPSTVLFHQAAASGITQAGLIDRIIRSALEVHAHKRGPL